MGRLVCGRCGASARSEDFEQAMGCPTCADAARPGDEHDAARQVLAQSHADTADRIDLERRLDVPTYEGGPDR
jgi:hypothetical protein